MEACLCDSVYKMNHTTKTPKNQDDLLAGAFGIPLLMWKVAKLWIRLNDVMNCMTDNQLDFVLSRGVGLMANRTAGGTYVLYDDWLNAAPANAKPALLEV